MDSKLYKLNYLVKICKPRFNKFAFYGLLFLFTKIKSLIFRYFCAKIRLDVQDKFQV